ncbi:MAG TPA: phosphoglucosamine mutase [Pirellulales bacterium]|nr:phosphoglucosamine mutase [Pirellulales bacterium]
MSEPIISVSGLRGIVGESLTPEVAIRYVCAFAESLPPGRPVLVSRDGRATGRMLAQAVCSGLEAVGRDTIDAGVAATPTTGVLVRTLLAAGGVQISASHNPPEYNGLKLFSAEGRVIPAADGRRVLDQYRTGKIGWVPHNEVGHAIACADTLSAHCALVLKTVDVERIRRRKFRVLLDSNHGAGSCLGRRLLDELGCKATILGEKPDGQYEHTPEPTQENLSGVLARVREVGADIGFCQDPDADRLAIIDEAGRYIGEEYTLALCVDHVLRSRPGPVVTNCSTSRMTEDLAEKYKVPFFRSAVGEANVVEAMQRHNAVIGGEGNGGAIDPRVVFVRDSFVGMALVLDAMAAREEKISRLADELPRYEIVKTKISLMPEKIPAGLAALKKHFADAKSDTLDGLRLDWPGKWLLVRASNTEPIVRAIAEAPTTAEARRLCDEAAQVLAKV